MDIHELREDKTVKEWLANLNPSINTEKAYLQGLKGFTEYTKMMPSELKEEAKTEIKAIIDKSDRKLKGYFIGYRAQMKSSGLADYTIKSRMMGVRSFFESFEIDIPKLQGERRRARTRVENDQIPTKEDIQTALKVCDPLEKALMLTGISSGLASNEIRNLTIRDFKKGYDSVTGVTTLNIKRGKTGVSFTTFLSREASNAILEYLNYRDRITRVPSDRREQQLEKQRVISDKGYLFVLRRIDDDFLKTGNEELRKLTENAISSLYSSISEKAKKCAPKGIYNVIRSHTMRKYFNSQLYNAECGEFYIEYWMGHTIDETRAAYFRASPEKMREIYLKFVPYLTVQKEADVSESPEYLRIKHENQVLQVETARHIVERTELQELKADFEKMKKINEDTSKFQQKVINFADPVVLEQLRKFLNENQ